MIEFRIKEKTKSLNQSFRGDWRPRAAVAKRQRTKAMQVCPKWPGGPLLVVRLTRMSPGTLDKVNLAGSLKHIEDGVAARLGVDDASPLVAWEYNQTKGEAEVVVQIWRWNAEGDAPPLPVGRPAERGRGKTSNPPISRAPRHRCTKNGCRRLLPCPEHSHHLLRPSYEPPRSAPPNAAREAEETFTPAPLVRCDFCKRERPRAHMLLGSDPADRHRLALRGFDGREGGTPWPTAMCLDDRRACDAIHDSAV